MKRIVTVQLLLAVASLALSACSSQQSERRVAQADVDSATIQGRFDANFVSAGSISSGISFTRDPGFGQPGGTSLVITDYGHSQIDCFNSAGLKTAEIDTLSTTRPEGAASDSRGNLYLVLGLDYGQHTELLVYSGGCKGMPRTIHYSLGSLGVTGIAVDGNGNLALAGGDIFGGSSVIFSDGSGQIIKTVPTGSLVGSYCAFDKAGNLFVDGFVIKDYGKRQKYYAGVGEIVGGVSGNATTTLSTGNTLLSPGGMQVGDLGRIDILDPIAKKIYRYAPPTGNVLGNPLLAVSLPTAQYPYPRDGPDVFAFVNGEKAFWAPNVGIGPIAYKFAYPAGASPLQTIPGGGPNRVPGHTIFGITVIPPLAQSLTK